MKIIVFGFFLFLVFACIALPATAAAHALSARRRYRRVDNTDEGKLRELQDKVQRAQHRYQGIRGVIRKAFTTPIEREAAINAAKRKYFRELQGLLGIDPDDFLHVLPDDDIDDDLGEDDDPNDEDEP